jgi:outer membrane biosynthesis protein TonB
MRRLVLLALVLGCAHAAPAPAEVEVPLAESRNLQFSDGVTAPVRKSCRLKGPPLASGDRISGSVAVDYKVGADGRVSAVAVKGDATEGAVRAVRRYLESCRYAPATQNGKPVAVRWKGELRFGDAINSVPR